MTYSKSYKIVAYLQFLSCNWIEAISSRKSPVCVDIYNAINAAH